MNWYKIAKLETDNPPEILFVLQKNGVRVSKEIIPPLKSEVGGFPMTIWRVRDSMGKIINDESTIVPRSYFTSESDAINAMYKAINSVENL